LPWDFWDSAPSTSIFAPNDERRAIPALLSANRR
jgi:hypothetical protein